MPQNSNGAKSNGTRVIALVGPAGAGKTSVAEAILHAAGATDRHGSVGHGTSIGDSSPESRSRGGSTELNLYNFDYLGDHFALIDCPGSVGFAADGLRGLAVADLAIVVVDPDQARAPLAAPALRALDEQGIPHIIFVNRIDQAHGRIRDLLSALQPVSVSPLIARQIPIREADQITGFVDLALERAFHYNGNDSEQIDIPGDLQDREHEARNHMLEQLADHDDELLEQLLMDQTPSNDRVLQDLARETGESLGVPVLFGSAESGWGMGRLLKALRHETPGPESSAARLEVSDPALYVFKIANGGNVGRLALARALGGRIGEGSDLKTRNGETARLGALFRMQGEKTQKVSEAQPGDVVAVAKIDNVKGGEWLSGGALPPAVEVQYPSLNCTLAIEPADRKDDVKLSGALHRILEEDPALVLDQDDDAHEMRLRGINDEHLKTVLARLKRRWRRP